MAAELNYVFLEASAKSGENIDNIFERMALLIMKESPKNVSKLQLEKIKGSSIVLTPVDKKKKNKKKTCCT